MKSPTEPHRAASTPRQPSRARRPEAAFTLLEVMAAVSILSIWYLMIANAADQGLRSEGDSRRRLEAALIADSRLAALEASSLDGSVPEDQDELTEEGDFMVRVIVSPLSAAAAAAGQSLQAAPGVAGEAQAPTSLLGLLSQEAPDAAANLRMIQVEVIWEDAAEERKLIRTSYVFDQQTALEALADLEGGDDEEES